MFNENLHVGDTGHAALHNTLAKHLNRKLTVKDYGATGDGVTDDASTINAAFSAGVGIFPAGQYKHLSPLIAHNGLVIQGAGIDATVLINGTTTQDSIQTTSARRLIVRDLTIQGSPLATAGNALNFDAGDSSGSSFHVENVAISGHYNGIRHKDTVVAVFDNVRIDAPRHDGFVVAGTCNALTYRNCYVTAPVRHGYYVNGNYISFLNCACDHAGGDAYHLYANSDADAPSSVSLYTCGAELTTGSAVYVEHGKNISIHGCYFDPSTADTITLLGVNSWTVENTTVHSTTGYAVRVGVDAYGNATTDGFIRGGIFNGSSGQFNDASKMIVVGRNSAGQAVLGIGTYPAYLIDLLVSATNLMRFGKGSDVVTVYYNGGLLFYGQDTNNSFNIMHDAPTGSLSLEAGGVKIAPANGKIGVFGVTPISRPVLATGAGRTVDDVITALQNLGWVKQS